jgi:hypothetical protein
MSDLRTRFVLPETLREKFNKGQYALRLSRGELSAHVMSDRHPRRPKSDDPICTRSQYVAYYERGGRKVAEVHQYLRPDGSLGASQKPDPKRLWIEDELWAVLGPAPKEKPRIP